MAAMASRGDIDNDGMDEIYVCQPGGLPNKLFKFSEDGTVADITAAWGVDILDDTSCACFSICAIAVGRIWLCCGRAVRCCC